LLSISVYVATIRTPIHLDAYGTAFVSGLIVYCVVLLLQPIRAHFDADRNPDVKLSFSGVSETMKLVISNPQLRDLSLGAFSFGGLQAIFSGFFILFMIDGLNYSEAEAGSAFAIAAVTAVGARILWGYLGSAFLSARIVLGGIGLFGGVAAILTSFYDVRWSYSMILAVAILYNVTALSWHGILLAEVARLAPPEKVGGVTGGVLAFTSVAMMIYPAFYGGLLAVTESYSIGFILCAAPSFIAGVIFLRPPIEAPWTRSVLAGLVWCLRLDRLAYGTVIAVIGALIGMFAVYARMT
ncbi:MAG: MFS transporter, partial [Rickettsiales bacterium]